IKTLYIKSIFMFEKTIIKEKNVSLVWLYSYAKKHRDNSLLLDGFMKQAKYNNLLYSWRVAGISDCRFNNDIRLERLEKYLSYTDILLSILFTVKIIFMRNKIDKLFSEFEFVYGDFNLNRIIKTIAMDYILIESPDIYRFTKGFERFIKNTELKLIGGDLNRQKLGIAVESIVPINDIPKYIFSLFAMPKNNYIKYSRRCYPNNYWNKLAFFVQNDNDKAIVTDEVPILGAHTIVYGSFRGSGFLSETKQEAIEEYGIIEKNYTSYILYDFSTTLFGYMSLEEMLSVLDVLVNFVTKKTTVLLLVKPHPSANIDVVNAMMRSITLENVIFLTREDNVNYALALSDIVITKYSTIGIEAMKCDSLVISYQLAKTNTFKLYGDEGNYVYSLAQLEKELKTTIENSEYRNLKLKKQKQFYNSNFSEKINHTIVKDNLLKLGCYK
ncbi:hypothetical protein, partial [Vibrio bathopelagicus]